MKKYNLYTNVAIIYGQMANTIYTKVYNMPISYEREQLKRKAERYAIKAGVLVNASYFDHIKYSK